MEKSKNYYKYLDISRIMFCIAVLLYHFNVLKGGYLAVCSFFALSGYLACISAFKKEKFSILEYYKKRLIKIYLPLLAVVFMTIAVIPLFSEVNWINLKPETTSVLAGYNNFWQLKANLDYFARHVNSPFMHLWYVAILLQFELVFPFLFIGLKKLGEYSNKVVPCIVLAMLSIGAAVIFYIMSIKGNIMNVYYNTFTRVFSILFGMTLGFINSYYGKLIIKPMKKKVISQIMVYLYLIILAVLFVFISASSRFFNIAMIGVTLITLRLIEYATTINKTKMNTGDNVVKSLAEVSYEIYLVQYPLIFFAQYININKVLKYGLLMVILVVLSYIIHFAFGKKNKNILMKILRLVLLVAVIAVAGFGCYQYVIAEDHTEEMKQLEEQLNQNQEIVAKRHEEYEANYKQEQENLKAAIADLENNESKLEELVSNMSVVGVGDSVMLGGVRALYEKFPNGYFDAKVSRSAWAVPDILEQLKAENKLGNPVVINIGANGDCPLSQKKKIVDLCEDREVFWLTVTNDRDVNVNSKLKDLANEYSNLHIIDWEQISKGHYDYFYADGIHLDNPGRIAYSEAIYQAIYDLYKSKYAKQKEEILNNYEEEKKNKISFYGDDILVNAFDDIEVNFKEAKFNTNNKYTYEILKQEIQEAKENDTLTYKIVFAFDKKKTFKKNEYKELFELCGDKKIFVVSTNKNVNEIIQELEFENVVLIDFYKEIEENPNYLMVDKIHLTAEGNKALGEILNQNVK